MMLAAAMVGNRQSGPSERGYQRSRTPNKAKATATGRGEIKKHAGFGFWFKVLFVCVCVCAPWLCVACGFAHEKAAALFLCTPQLHSALNPASHLPRAENKTNRRVCVRVIGDFYDLKRADNPRV